MTLVDTGPLLAIVDPHLGQQHIQCRAELARLTGPLITTWPCVTEAMHLADRHGGPGMQRKLWLLLHAPIVEFQPLTKDDAIEMDALMTKYANVPMDLADASLLIAAEARYVRRIFTLDSDFRIYRLRDGRALEVVPE